MHLGNNRVLIENHQCFVLQPDVLDQFGRSAALFLQQLHYWISSNKEIGLRHAGKRWIYNTMEQWAQALHVSTKTVERIIKKLHTMDVISIEKLSARKSDRTNYYTINYQKLSTFLPTINHSYHIDYKDGSTDKMTRSPRQNVEVYMEKTDTTAKDTVSIDRQAKQVRKKEKNTLAQDLLEIWNQVVEQGKISILLTKKRAQFLIAAYKFKFSSCLESWRAFCKQITSSKFLMGEIKNTFRASLDWTLRFDIIQRILEGGYGTEIPDREVEEERQEISFTQEQGVAGELKAELLSSIGKAAFISWFIKDVVWKMEHKRLLILTKTRFYADYISTNFEAILTAICERKGLQLQGIKVA